MYEYRIHVANYGLYIRGPFYPYSICNKSELAASADEIESQHSARIAGGQPKCHIQRPRGEEQWTRNTTAGLALANLRKLVLGRLKPEESKQAPDYCPELQDSRVLLT